MARTHIIALISSVILLIIVLELVRRRKLKEEYCWLWLFAATCYFLTAVRPDLTKKVASFIGTSNIALAFTFLGLLFIVLILIHYSIRLSELSTRVKDLAQQIAILDSEQNEQIKAKESEDDNKEEPTSSDFIDESQVLSRGTNI